MSSPTLPKQTAELNQLLIDQIDSVDQYNQLLDRIEQAISANQVTELQQLLQSNTGQFAAVENSRRSQMAFLHTCGLEESDDGLLQCIEDMGSPPNLVDNQTRLFDHLRRMQKKLQVNDRIIRQNQQRVKQAIRVLSGYGTNSNATTYSREGGQSSTDDSSHTIAIA